MGKNQIISFLQSTNNNKLQLQQQSENHDKQYKTEFNSITSTNTISKDAIPLEIIHEKIDNVLNQMNETDMMNKRINVNNDTGCTTYSFQLRRAVFDQYHDNDAKAILKLVSGLALYEKALDEVDVNESIYEIDGNGNGNNPMFHCILLEKVYDDDDFPIVIGMGFFYFSYSLQYNGRFLWLEDLFIEEKYRGNGFGKAIMYVLAGISKEIGCERFVWQALDWNTPALNFYDSIGANVCEGFMTLRLDKEQIKSFQFEY
jgi:ribosomal protein S18 acetylase RimI-like enzyme